VPDDVFSRIMEAKETLGSIITTIGRKFYQSRLNNPDTFRIETVKQGYDV
jgi:hypothetical protein